MRDEPLPRIRPARPPDAKWEPDLILGDGESGHGPLPPASPDHGVVRQQYIGWLRGVLTRSQAEPPNVREGWLYPHRPRGAVSVVILGIWMASPSQTEGRPPSPPIWHRRRGLIRYREPGRHPFPIGPIRRRESGNRPFQNGPIRRREPANCCRADRPGSRPLHLEEVGAPAVIIAAQPGDRPQLARIDGTAASSTESSMWIKSTSPITRLAAIGPSPIDMIWRTRHSR